MAILAERYQLADLVYSDAWVVAYRARDQLLNRDVTVELLRPERAEPGADERLLAKGRLAALTSLPHVAAIYDQGTVDGRPFLVLEEPLGPALADAVPLKTAAAVELVENLAQTQRSALRRRQTIPTLTPWTIRLAGDGRVQVMDLGLDQEQPSDDAAVRQLGRLLDSALGPASQEAGLRDIAARAAHGSIASVDELLDELRSVRHAPKTTEIMSSEDLSSLAPGAAKAFAPVHTKARKAYTAARSSDAPTAALRSRPQAPGRSGGMVLAAALAVALVVAIGAALANGLPEQQAPSREPSTAIVASAQASASTETSTAPSSKAAPSTVAASAAPAGDTYIVAAIGNPPQLRLRDGPGTDYRRIGALPNGTIVQIVDGPLPADNYNWVQVRAGDTVGWCILEGLKRR